MEFSNGIASQLNVGIILPEGIVVLSLLVVLLGDLIAGRSSGRWTPYAAIGGLLAAMAALAWQWDAQAPLALLGSFSGDNFSIVFRGLIALSTAITILMSVRYVEQSGSSLAEFIAMLLTGTLGGMLLAGANELVMVFVSLETLSIASYLMAGYMKRDARSNEAALKYLLFGAASSAIFLYGASLLYGLSGGKTYLSDISAALAQAGEAQALGSAVALVFLITGIAFKISAVPFHQWTPDVYEGSPTPLVAFLSVGSKAAGFALAIRLLVAVFPLDSDWRLVFAILALLSMVVGNAVAIAQTSMKRMLAYSSIGQAGFVMLGLVAATEAGYASVIFYLLVYLFMNLGAFTGVTLFSLRTGSDQIAEYAGLYQKDPLLTLTLTICLLSLGGIPPLAGFFGKLYLFWAGWQAGLYGLVIVALVTSVISIYYYVRVIKMMVVKETHEMSASVRAYPQVQWHPLGMRPLQVGLVLSTAGTIAVGILANPILSVTDGAIARTAIFQTAQAQPPDTAPASVEQLAGK